MTTTVRRTSAYSFTVLTPHGALDARTAMAAADRLRDYLLTLDRGPVTDSHHRVAAGRAAVSASLRLPDDATARRIALQLAEDLGYDPATVSIRTGYGMHRRDVTP